MLDLTWNRLKLVHFCFCRQVRSLGELFRVEVTRMVLAPIDADLRPPPLTDRPNTRLAAGVIRARGRVLAILRPGRLAKVQQDVVRPIAVAVVNVCWWQIPMHIEPSKPVMQVVLAIDHRGDVPVFMSASDDSANGLAALAALDIREFTRLRAI